jgi:hypothetical protein
LTLPSSRPSSIELLRSLIAETLARGERKDLVLTRENSGEKASMFKLCKLKVLLVVAVGIPIS